MCDDRTGACKHVHSTRHEPPPSTCTHTHTAARSFSSQQTPGNSEVDALNPQLRAALVSAQLDVSTLSYAFTLERAALAAAAVSRPEPVQVEALGESEVLESKGEEVDAPLPRTDSPPAIVDDLISCYTPPPISHNLISLLD